MGSLQPPASSLLGGLQSAPSASQGSLLGLRLDSGRLPAADAAAATAAVSTFGGASRSSGSMQLGQLGPSSGPQQQAQDALRQHASLPLAAALQAPTAKEDLWLLSQAYGSMTAEQKESLAAQPPEVRITLRQRPTALQRKPGVVLYGMCRGSAGHGSCAAQSASQARERQPRLCCRDTAGSRPHWHYLAAAFQSLNWAPPALRNAHCRRCGSM